MTFHEFETLFNRVQGSEEGLIMDNKELMTQWIDRLRSGKIKQGFAALYNKTDCSFCALGVLADIMHPGELQAAVNFELYYYDADEFLKPFNLTFRDVYMKNDVEEMTFAEIADWLEEKMKSKDAA